MNDILILGGYGNFGKRIATALVKDGIGIIIAGRNALKANELGTQLQNISSNTGIKIAIFDANTELKQQLEKYKPKIVINTVGPFQTANYNIAKICIECGVHYIDLADGENSFVILAI